MYILCSGHETEYDSKWSKCCNGSMQSPINLLNKRVKMVSHLGRLDRDYKPSNATLKNRGHDMMMGWKSGAGTVEINGTEYVLQQCHWHSPCEHTINGRRHALEMHMVHKSQDGKVAVVGIIYKTGSPNSFLSSLSDHLRMVGGPKEAEKVVDLINPNDIKIARKYYRYMGSLTSPPSTENVIWTISRKVMTVTKEQVKLVRVTVRNDSGTNARPLQPQMDD
ncbi:alpha carbonic anhydrase 7-like [Hevea brasiliensis]|uniref:alpha carbonic anhydrase 7-like n=1 Tax=Hevea brasiliensis TaxID=3981 RepID=UPI0025DE20FF|nr:alpha carbonic anhydrase 7-like [Hevea brasiliensis]